MNKMTKLETVKGGVDLIVGVGIFSIIRNTISAVTPPTIRIPVRICIWVAELAIGSMVYDAVTSYVGEGIDNFVADCKKSVAEVELTLVKSK
jgi:hypothetical protein